MAAPTAQPVTTVVRTVLTANPDLSVEDVARQLKARGLKVTGRAVKKAVYNVRSELRKGPAAPAAAQPAAAPPAASPATGELGLVLANVSLVNKMVGTCGGVDQARQVAEAVRSCGSVDMFLQHLDIVAGIRASTAPA